MKKDKKNPSIRAESFYLPLFSTPHDLQFGLPGLVKRNPKEKNLPLLPEEEKESDD